MHIGDNVLTPITNGESTFESLDHLKIICLPAIFNSLEKTMITSVRRRCTVTVKSLFFMPRYTPKKQLISILHIPTLLKNKILKFIILCINHGFTQRVSFPPELSGIILSFIADKYTDQQQVTLAYGLPDKVDFVNKHHAAVQPSIDTISRFVDQFNQLKI